MLKTVLKFDIDEIDNIVENNPEYQKELSEFHGIIEQFKGDMKLYDSICRAVIGIEDVTRRIAFESGFAEGVRHITGIMSGKEALSHK